MWNSDVCVPRCWPRIALLMVSIWTCGVARARGERTARQQARGERTARRLCIVSGHGRLWVGACSSRKDGPWVVNVVSRGY
eukprot:431849-Prymnesium_polylepis.1